MLLSNLRPVIFSPPAFHLPTKTVAGVTGMPSHRKFSRASCRDLYRNLKPASWVLDEMTFWPSSTTEAPSPNTDCKQQPHLLLSSCSLCSGGSNSTPHVASPQDNSSTACVIRQAAHPATTTACPQLENTTAGGLPSHHDSTDLGSQTTVWLKHSPAG